MREKQIQSVKRLCFGFFFLCLWFLSSVYLCGFIDGSSQLLKISVFSIGWVKVLFPSDRSNLFPWVRSGTTISMPNWWVWFRFLFLPLVLLPSKVRRRFEVIILSIDDIIEYQVLLGDMGAGKSSLVMRFVKGQFLEFQVIFTLFSFLI